MDAGIDTGLERFRESFSGSDGDAARVVSRGINKLRDPERATILVTHYQRLLNYVVPDYVHVLCKGKIIKSGGPELAAELEKRGYEWLTGTPVPA